MCLVFSIHSSARQNTTNRERLNRMKLAITLGLIELVIIAMIIKAHRKG